MLLAKLESGLLGFETEHGFVFVQPSGWQRVHLLWTFRNFQSLSIKLLKSFVAESAPQSDDRYFYVDGELMASFFGDFEQN